VTVRTDLTVPSKSRSPEGPLVVITWSTINRFLLFYLEKLLFAQVERLLMSRPGSNSVPFDLRVQRFTSLAILPANEGTLKYEYESRGPEAKVI
jgi:hypothetical protein